MMNIFEYLQTRLETSERGAAAVEYALLVSLIAVAIVVAVGLLGGTLSDTFDSIRNSIG
jgi:pilus assembly protein Flp/PilA